MTQTEVQALIQLLDDPDEHIFSHVREKLAAAGSMAIPLLENAWEHHALGHVFQERVEDLIHDIHFGHICEELKAWSDSQDPSLLDGWLAISRYAYPDLKAAPIRKFFNKLLKDIWLELHDDLTALERVNVLNHVLFEVYGFSANRKNFHDSSNSFINYVLEHRKGNPVALSMIYLIASRELGLPIEGINLPRHFVVAYLREHEAQNHEPVLFYINPFSGGVVFSGREIEEFLTEIGVTPMPEYFVPTHNRAIIYRVLNNLKYAYQAEGLMDKVEDIAALQAILAARDEPTDGNNPTA
jgi:regulator of sirC expression with transglutaminase-like and TPR domain